MAYIQLDDFGGKTRGLKFNQLSLEVFTKNLDYERASVSSTIYATFYAGLVGNSYAKQEDVDYTFEEVTEWVDKIYEAGRVEDIEKVCQLWEATHIYRVWLDQFKERVRLLTDPSVDDKDTVKKKVT